MPKSVGLLPLPTAVRSLTRPMFRSLGIAASGLSAQRQRMETIASNLANAETTRAEDGAPYRRRIVRLEAAAGQQGAFGIQPPRADPAAVFAPVPPAEFRLPPMEPEAAPGGVRVAGVDQDASEGPLVYDPGHPDANDAGYVRYPNVRITDEMIDLMETRRVYEANATVFQSAKAMLRRALDI
jgi:flagellar basal-body rod protein FlgC